ncbi:replication endonuclease [Burkholderia pseudomallei]|uniref:replication endonuclease n=1 Tax=Burkholderia pseudomallei TaxID=28450 RepID=UPI0019DFC5D9|nr:replication endonuclease [Burkholderia pseudomallei]MBF3470661.1 replication endonuclease [Burkholderia pseudomallei]MBF3526322.1 replication endonuclease [Burkholderia pseudomallei]MBF3642639.1 replication endonuclease [Burkholderia pseudomallei]
MPYRRLSTDEEWSAERVAALPPRWRARIIDQYDARRASSAPDARRESNLFLLSLTDQLNAVRMPLGADDGVICDRAAQLAGECGAIGEVFQHDTREARAAMERIVRAHQCEPPLAERVDERTGEIRGVRDVPAVKRMTDPMWWRRALRNMHARHVEAAAIALGYVNVARDIYVSDESLARRTQQRNRNQAMLEQTVARNEEGDEFTLAELAARGVANKAIRRAELMTRIAGFEQIARELGHIGLFFTITCPSRMHKWRKAGGKARENPLYDGTKPNEAQKYLATMFARLRAKLARVGVQWYGFRIAEPNHDGTPHWHVLVFFAPAWRGDERRAALPRVCALVRRYAIQDSPSERGAKQHRADFEPIDWSRGSAAGYIAKYVAKNIDGYKVGDDLYGNPALESSARVEAWASTWRIRQFQQVGGPPVTVWRELRRVDEIPEGAPAILERAHAAANKVESGDGQIKPASWADFIKANGGIGTSRNDRPIQLAKDWDYREGRYGEAVGEVVRGVRACGWVTYRDGIVPNRKKLVTVFVDSVRHAWEIVSRRVAGGLKGVRAGAARAWTRVNNCTPRGDAADDDIADWISDYERAERYGGFATA